MQALSKNNHFGYGYTENFHDFQKNSIFYTSVGELQLEPASFLSECVDAVADIYQRSQGKPIFVTLSAGADSEAVFRSFLLSKISFQVAILRFDNNFNQHDVQPAIKLCDDNGIKYTIFDLDVFDFYEKRQHLIYAAEYGLTSPMIATHLWLAEQIIESAGGIPIFSGDYCKMLWPPNSVRRSKELPQPELMQGQVVIPNYYQLGSFGNPDHFAIDRFLQKQNSFGVANFFLYSPTQIAASLENGFDPQYVKFEIETLLKSKTEDESQFHPFYRGQIALNACKEKFFDLAGFSMSQRFSKWTGFELIHYFMATKNKPETLSSALLGSDSIEGMTIFNSLYRNPMHQIVEPTFLKKIMFHPSLYAFTEKALKDRP